MTTTGGDKIEEAAEVANKVAETNTSTVTLNDGTVVTIYVCKAKNVGVVLSAALVLMENLGIKTLGELPEADFTNPTVFLKLLAKSSEDIFMVTSELCSIELTELMELDVDDVLAIMMQVVIVNKGFFSQRIAPLLPSGLPQNPVKKPSRKRR